MPAETFAAASPRLTPRRTPIGGAAFQGAVLFLAVVLLLLSFLPSVTAPWAAGLALLLYDIALIAFTIHRLRPGAGAAREDREAAGNPLFRPSMTVIIAAYNEAAILPDAIARLLDQSEPPHAILIADDGSTDATAAILFDRFGLSAPEIGRASGTTNHAPGVRWLRLEHGGKARSVNRAIALAQTEIVVLLDADTLLDVDALRAMRDAFAHDRRLVAATGIIEPFGRASRIGRVMRSFQAHEYRRTALMSRAWQQDNALQLIAGAFVGFRRDALLAVGGFDPHCLVEDYELAHRLHRHAAERRLDWTIGIVGEAIAFTEAPSTPAALLRQRRRWFGGFLQTHWWNRDMIANALFGRLGTRLMIVKTFDAVQPIVGLTAAACLLLALATGKSALFGAALAILVARALINLVWTAWSLRAYRLWTARSPRPLSLGAAFIGLTEPWTYRVVRYVGELWGWTLALRGDTDWSPVRVTASPPPAPR